MAEAILVVSEWVLMVCRGAETKVSGCLVEEEEKLRKRATHSTKWGLSSLGRCFPGLGHTVPA